MDKDNEKKLPEEIKTNLTNTENSLGEFLIYTTPDGKKQIQVRLIDETVWLSQKLMAELFQKDVRTINEHILNVFAEGELPQDNSVIRKFRITASDGKNYDTNFYSLDMIISVGYRVKSLRGTQFRQWATQRLKEYLIKGYAINKEYLKILKVKIILKNYCKKSVKFVQVKNVFMQKFGIFTQQVLIMIRLLMLPENFLQWFKIRCFGL